MDKNLNFVKLLDDILLSDKCISKFYLYYNNDEEFRNWLITLIPEVEKCRVQEQNTPWHIYNVLDHILHSVESMNSSTKNMKTSDRRLLAYTMFYHDLGKPDCHFVNESSGTKVDSFWGHDDVGSKIVTRTAASLDFSNEEVKQMEFLVKKHDIFSQLTDKKSKLPYQYFLDENFVATQMKECQNLGDSEKLIHFLTMIGRADNNAKNPIMIKRTMKYIDKIDEYAKSLNFEPGAM